jgi:hypothetical protein
MSTKTMNEPWKKDTNDRYLETVRAVMSLSTGSLLLPAFFSRNFLDIAPNTPLICIFGFSIYFAWALLGLSILCGIFFHYLSAKWVRIAWGKEAGIFWSKNTPERKVESCMEAAFWLCIIGFLLGVAFTLYFFTTICF